MIAKLIHKSLLTLIPLALLCSCSFLGIKTDGSLIHRLNGRGPVALSTNNPYVAQNLLIAEEMEKSTEVNNFIKHRGAPAVLEVYKEFFSSVVLYFYYPENGEYFAIEELNNNWVIKGPKPIEKESLGLVHKALEGIKGKPRVNFPDNYKKKAIKPKKKKTRDIFDPTNDKNLNQDPTISQLDQFKEAQLDRIGDSQKPTPTEASPSNESKMEKIEFNNSFSSPSVKSRGTLSPLDKIIQTEGNAPAEVTPKGDLVHYVTYPGENLKVIASWYTKEGANAGRLARMNQIVDPNKLELGDVIIIPTYLLKNTNRLTESAIQKLRNLN